MSYETKLTAHAFDLSPPLDIIPMAPIRVGLLVSWETGQIHCPARHQILKVLEFQTLRVLLSRSMIL